MRISFGVSGAALLLAASLASAQDYPSQPVRMIVTSSTGSTVDTIGRLLVQRLSAQLKGNFFAENRTGANGLIGVEFVVKSKPDGYNLLFNTPSVVLAPAFGEKLSYDVFKDLMPVALVGSSPLVLFVNPAVPANNVAEFIAHLKANPDKLNYGSSGTGNITHLGSLLFLQANGLSAVHVPYKGGAPAILDVVGGRIQFAMQSQTPLVPLAKDKRIKPLGIAGVARSPLLPDVPTMNEAGMPGFEIGTWVGVMAAAKTPAAIVNKLNAEIAKAMKDPAMTARLTQEGAEPLSATPEEYDAYLKREYERWSRVIKTAGVKPE
jgi:tripartite-type tricarboxylate transporter receptor subunit TctC